MYCCANAVSRNVRAVGISICDYVLQDVLLLLRIFVLCLCSLSPFPRFLTSSGPVKEVTKDPQFASSSSFVAMNT